MFTKVLVANRGEIALRIVRALRDLDIKSVAVYSDVDRLSTHVRYADEARPIGPADARLSYLNAERIIAEAKAAGADAIHPGYGFLAENADFAEACVAAGLTFIGPSPESIRALGDKIHARTLALKAGIPMVPGSPEVENLDEAAALAREIGYPVMVKASAGGGGRGIRLVEDEESLRDAATRAMQEAQAAFGNPSIYLEKHLSPVRHIEVQIIADRFGNTVAIGERECSIQRRHQKLIEESPSIAVSPTLRRALGQAAVKLAKAANYQNVGTVEFLLTESGDYYFLEMNTRLQVEHPVTELVTGIDIVQMQIRVAAGEKLPFLQRNIEMRGHAIECRVNAEDPYVFTPSPGRITLWHAPGGPGVRVDSHAYTNYYVPPNYDSMIGKIIVHGDTREQALARMRIALSETVVEGIQTNIPLHRELMVDAKFVEGGTSIHYLGGWLAEHRR